MIEIRNLTKGYNTSAGWNLVLDDISATFPTGRNVGILGLNGAGKSTLLRMIGGADLPDKGEIRKDVRVSWPIGFGGGFQADMTGREGARFIARIFGADVREVEDFVEEFSELGRYFDLEIRTYSSGMRGRLSFATSMAIKFDCYLVDEAMSAGDARFRERYRQTFLERTGEATLVMVSHQSNSIEEFCDSVAVLFDHKLYWFDELEEGMKYYDDRVKSLRRARKGAA